MRILTTSILTFAFVLSSATMAEAERITRGNLVLENIPEPPAEVTTRLAQYQNARSAFLRGWHPSGQGILISTRFGDTSQVHWVREPGGARRQLTFSREPIGEMAVQAKGGKPRVVYGRDVGGSEFYQLFTFDLATSREQMITDGTSRNGGASLSRNGDRVAFYTTQRNGRDWDLHIKTLDGDTPPAPVLEAGGTWFPAGWSPDDTKMLVVRYVSANESHPHVLDVATGALTRIDPSDEPVSYGAIAWSHDGAGLYLSSDRDSEFRTLRHLDLASGTMTDLTADIPWDVSEVAVSPNGRWLAFVINEDGVGALRVWRADTREPVALPEMPVGQTGGLSFDHGGDRLGMVINARSPSDVYALSLDDGTLTRWTESEVGGLDTSRFASAELIHYPTFDQVDGEARTIPAFVYKPAHAGSGPHPVVVLIHGGPEGQSRPAFSPTIQYWVNELGLTVIQPNVRGSTGYGKSYVKLDNGFKREDSVKDIGALLDWIDDQDDLDSERVAVYGGSYGGYMVLASMAHYNDRLRGGVDIVGISNFVTFLENTQDYRRDLRRVEYGDERDPEMRAFLERISPTTNAHKITKPLFIAQGQNDPRVPVGEADQIFAAVKANGGDPWYLLAKDEGHGFAKKQNRDVFERAVVMFFDQILRDEPRVAPAGEPVGP